MKMTPELRHAAEKMKPGALTRHGFFGSDERDLATIINDQRAACRRLGVSWQAIAQAMKRVGRQGLAGFGAPVAVEGTWEVVANENRGKLPSPFPRPGMYQKTVFTVTNLATKKTVRYTELAIHLIDQYGFFQGKGSPFYNPPKNLVDVLVIEPTDQAPEVPLP